MSKNADLMASSFAVVLLLLAHVADRLRVAFSDNLESIVYDSALRPLGGLDIGAPHEVQHSHSAIQNYRKQEPDTAERLLVEFNNIIAETCSNDIFERIALLRPHPPGAVWDGAFTVQSK